MSHLFGEALQHAARAIRNPALDRDDLERIRTRVMSELRVSAQTASSVARRVIGRTIFGSHPYGMPLGGTIETNAEISADHIRAALASRITPRDATLVFVGDLTQAQGIAFAESAFGDWETASAGTTAPSSDDIPGVPLRREIAHTVVIDLPDSGRSAVFLGYPALARADSHFLEATVLNALLSGYSGRLNREIRVKRGLSYGAGSALHARRLGGSMLASTLVEHAKVGETVDVMREVMQSLRVTPATEDDLQIRKAMLRGAFGRGLESLAGIAGALGSQVVYDLPSDDLDTYLHRLEAVEPDGIATLAREILAAEPQVVVVGEGEILRRQLHGHTLLEIAASDLDLRRQSLRRSGEAQA
jgi:zinc protease